HTYLHPCPTRRSSDLIRGHHQQRKNCSGCCGKCCRSTCRRNWPHGRNRYPGCSAQRSHSYYGKSSAYDSGECFVHTVHISETQQDRKSTRLNSSHVSS